MRAIKAILTCFYLLAVASAQAGDNPGNWPSPPEKGAWVLSVVYMAAKAGTGIALDGDTAALTFQTKERCEAFGKELASSMDGIVVRYTCQKI